MPLFLSDALRIAPLSVPPETRLIDGVDDRGRWRAKQRRWCTVLLSI